MKDDLLHLQSSLQAVQTPIIVINDKWHVLFVNDATMTMLEKSNDTVDTSLPCHQLLLKKSTPCEDCPLQYDDQKAKAPKSHIIQENDGTDLFVKEKIAQLNGYYVLTLFDMSREITALKTMDLTRKELTAKTIMAQQRHREKTEESHRLTQIVDQLPDALVLIDGNFGIKKKNKASEKMFPSKGITSCYEFFNNMLPCEDCPAENGFENIQVAKKTHLMNGHYIMETFSTMSEKDKGLLNFRATTRQIQLIEKIREQQETITLKNEILSSQIKLQAQMQKPIELRNVLELFLNIFLPICKTENGVIIINDIRKSSVWLTVNQGLNTKQENKLTGLYLSREVQSSENQEIPQNAIPWENTTQLQLMGGEGRCVGLILFEENQEEIESEVRHLFTEPLGAFIHNKLLMRQLEEKANTDPLTGLYNRGYIDETLSVEKEKFLKYGLHHAVVIADVNRLKQANDVYGHEAGDNLILNVSKRLNSAVRDTDIVARTGGDEFLLLLTDTDQSGAQNFIDRLKKQLFDNIYMPVGEDEKFPITVSFGAAATDKTKLDNLIKTADQHMYEAKKTYYKEQERYR